jgi:carboxymethylenebutenolidase
MTVQTTWNKFETDRDEGMICETVDIKGYNGDSIKAYVARPAGSGPHPGVVLITHMPGWDEVYREFTRRFAHHGFAAISPNIFQRFGHGAPDDVAAKARAEGGLPDASVIGDAVGAAEYLKSQSYSNGKVGVIGTCSGGRHTYLVAAKTGNTFAAAVNCWGGRVVQQPEELNERQPESPHSLTANIQIPILGLFGNDDQNPTPEMVNQLEEELKKHNKQYEFHRYDGAGHGFWYVHVPAYRPEAAMDAWNKAFAFFEKHLA